MATAPSRIPLPSKLPKTLPDPLQSSIEEALMRSPDEPVQRLLSTLETSLDATAWTQRVAGHMLTRAQKEPCDIPKKTRRTGYKVPAPDAEQDAIIDEIVSASRPAVPAQSKNTQDAGTGAVGQSLVSRVENLQIPSEVVERAVALLKQELQKLCEVDDDKYLDWRTNL